MTENEIREGVDKRKWFHCIQLPYGIITPGTREADAWQTYKLPERLNGKRVLDIGAWEGGFSFEAERRGAEHVVAMDVWGSVDEPGSGGYGWDNFQFAHDALQSRVVPEQMNVYSLSASLGPFDLILFLEVLYHLQDPFLGLRRVRSAMAKGGMVCMETWIDAEWVDEPAAIFYPGNELNGDRTNWWGPNVKCVQSLAAAAGFTSADLVWWRQDVHFGGRGKRACFHLS
jgi:tRNA (mo5U34)-methyltransferase